MKAVRISICEGRYYLGRAETQWRVGLETPYGSVSYIFEDEPNIQGLLPRQVLDIIEEQSKKAWIDTGREERDKKIATLREHEDIIDKIYLLLLLARAKAEVMSLNTQLAELKDCVIPSFPED